MAFSTVHSVVEVPDNLICVLCGFKAANKTGYKLHYGKKTCQLNAIKSARSQQVLSVQPCLPQIDQPLEERLRILRSTTGLVHRIPKAARIATAEILTKVIRDCINLNTMSSWTRLLTFSYSTFCLPEKKDRKVSLASIIKQNLFRSEASPISAKELTQPKPSKSDKVLRKRIEAKINDGDISGAVRLLSSDESVVSATVEVVENLKSKHPKSPEDITFPDELDQAELNFDISVEEVCEAVRSFPNGSAGGIDGLRPQHLKDLLGDMKDESSMHLAKALVDFVEHLLLGRVPADVCPFLYGAFLTAVQQKNGRLRPIAVGNTLRRLAGKIISRRLMVSWRIFYVLDS